MHPISPLEFRMDKTSNTYVWADERQPGIPRIRYPGGGIIQPLFFYFCYLARTNRELVSSFMARAYSLREWFAFLAGERVGWMEGGRDRYLSRFRQYLKDHRVEDSMLSDGQIELKLQRIFDFYRFIHFAMPISEDGKNLGKFVGPIGSGSSITSKVVRHEGEEFIVWIGHKSIKAEPPNPSVLDERLVTLVLSALRTVADGTDNSADRHEQILIAERNWLMGSTMAFGGLRAAETADIKISTITKALKEEGILDHLPQHLRKIHSVAELKGDTEAQELILNGLKRFEQRRRRNYIFVRIVGKGRKPRSAAFSIELVKDILIVGVWGFHTAVCKLRKMRGNSSNEDYLFLSQLTGTCLKPGSVADIMKDGFERADVEGSGHDFRKYYGTGMANAILRRVVNNLGYITHAVLHTVYHQVASVMGHQKITTTIRHYVDVAVVVFTGIANKLHRRKLLKIWEVLLEQQDNLHDPERIRLAATSVRALATVPKESELYAILEGVLTDPRYNPDGIMKFAIAKPPLKLVVSNNEPRQLEE